MEGEHKPDTWAVPSFSTLTLDHVSADTVQYVASARPETQMSSILYITTRDRCIGRMTSSPATGCRRWYKHVSTTP